MTRDELQPGTLVLVPHGGRRFGSTMGRVDRVIGDFAYVQRWRPSCALWSTVRAVRLADCRPVPANDRRLAQVRKATETTP